MIDVHYIHLFKAGESLAGAESEFGNRRYGNCANRCYYACFQAAVQALIQASIAPSGMLQWSHSFVRAQFAGQLVNRRKLYPAELRDALERTYGLRSAADYRQDLISRTQAARALNRTRVFVDAVRSRM